MAIKDRIIDIFFGNIIETKVSERLRAAATSEKEEIGWRKLTGNVSRNLPSLKQDRMIEIAYWLWENNPMAKWLIEITKDFILADGLPYETKNQKVKDLFDEFWYDPINRMDLYLEKYIRELFLYGELCLPVFVAKQTGKIRLGYIDPAQIKEVITDPDNIKMIIGVTLKDSAGERGKKLKTILPRDVEYFMSKKTQALRAKFTDGECFFFAINNVTNSPRGRSELLVVADWLDAYEQFLFDYADKWPLLNTFVWDLTIEGADEIQLNNAVSKFTKKSGSIFAHNEKMKLDEKTPDLKAVDIATGARIFRNHILGPFSYPEHWYGGGGDVNRATAVEMDAPAFKALSSKQRYVKYILETILEFVITKALEANYLKVSKEEDHYNYSVITPEVATKDLSRYATIIQQISTALTQAELQEWIDKKTARKIFTNMIGYLGIEMDIDEIEQALAETEEKKGYEDYSLTFLKNM